MNVLEELKTRRAKITEYAAALDLVIDLEERSVTDLANIMHHGAARGGGHKPRRRQKATSAVPAKNGRPNRRRGGKLTVAGAVRELFAGTSEALTGTQIRDRLRESHPELAEKLGSVSVYCIDLANRGEVDRQGKERDATYRKTAKLRKAEEPSPLESDYRKFRAGVNVPTES
jgi:hypothetical protein